MMRTSPTGPVFLALLLAFGVSMASSAATTPAPATEAATAESRKLGDLVDAYFEEQLKLNPLLATSIGDPRYNDRFEVTISPEWRARDEKVEREFLERIRAIDPTLLTGQDALTYEIFKSAREREIEGFRFPGHLIPVNQFYSVPNSFAQLGSGNGLHPFKTVKDYEDFLKRVNGFVAWTDQAIVNMREGIAKGYTLPKVLVERTLPQLAAQLVEKPEDSLYWGPIANLPASFTAEEQRGSPRPTVPRSRTRSSRPIVACTISCATSTCRRPAPASASTRCPTARPGTSTTSATSRRPTTRRRRSTRSGCARSSASTARCARSCSRSASRAASMTSSGS